MKKLYLTVSAAALFLMGIVLALAPRRYTTGLGSAHLLHAVRSFGGFYLGFAAYLVIALKKKHLTDGAVVAVVLAMTGLLTGRAISLVADGLPGPGAWASVVVELFLAAWGLAILRAA